jgi:hypothetical protein
MAVITETARVLEGILSEANGYRSREAVTVASGQNLPAGAVLGMVTATGEYAEHDPAATDGTETAAAILLYPTDASAAAVVATALVRDCEVTATALAWITGATAQNKADGLAALATVGVIAR